MTETLKLGSYRLEMILKAPAYLFGNVKWNVWNLFCCKGWFQCVNM